MLAMSVSKAILDQLPDSDISLLASKWVERRYRAHQLVIEHGDSNCDVFFLLEGRARVTLFTEAGKEVAYQEMGQGDIFGELAGIDGKVRSASIVALEPALVARLPQGLFRDFVRSNPGFAWILLEHLSDRLRRMTNRVYEFSTLMVRQRLICELLRRAEGKWGADGAALLDPAPTHVELAAYISTHREAVSREMSALAKRRMIEKRGGSLVLLERGTLELLAGKETDEE
jgi:CRP/FNR family transcriptional regulator, cyclic AMP receptor protein